jgi:hypothetical protein
MMAATNDRDFIFLQGVLMLNDERPILDSEIELIKALLNYAFPGDDAFSIQVDQLEKVMSWNYDDTLLKLCFKSAHSSYQNQFFRKNLSGSIEASGIDLDGEVVIAILWITDGEIRDLEFLRPDSKKVQRPPMATDLRSFVKAI